MGFLLDALEPSEMPLIEERLRRDPVLYRELAEAHEELLPLSKLCGYYDEDPPEGLAERTCRALWKRVDAEEEVSGTDVVLAETAPAAGKKSKTVLSDRDRRTPQNMSDHPGAPAADNKQTGKWPETCFGASMAATVISAPAPMHHAYQAPSDALRGERSLHVPSLSPKTKLPPREGGRYSTVRDWSISLAVGALLAVVAFPALQFVLERAIAVVYQTKMREIGESSNYLNQLHVGMKSTTSGNQTFKGFDPSDSTWHRIEYNTFSPAVSIPTLPELFTVSDKASPTSWSSLPEHSMVDSPLSNDPSSFPFDPATTFRRLPRSERNTFSDASLVSRRYANAEPDAFSGVFQAEKTSSSPPVALIQPAFWQAPPDIPQVSEMPKAWKQLIGGDNHFLIGGRPFPEAPRGQNILIDNGHVFFRNYPTKPVRLP